MVVMFSEKKFTPPRYIQVLSDSGYITPTCFGDVNELQLLNGERNISHCGLHAIESRACCDQYYQWNQSWEYTRIIRTWRSIMYIWIPVDLIIQYCHLQFNYCELQQ